MNNVKYQKERALQIEEIKNVMESKAGRNLMSRILITCGVYTTSYNPQLPDSNTIFNEGRRNVGLMLIAELQDASPALFNKMIAEQTEQRMTTTTKDDDNEYE